MRMSTIAAVLLAGVTLAGCGPEYGPKQGIGTVTGALAGGIIGSQIGQGSGNVVATAAGALLGGLIGSEIGRALDEQDRQRAYAAQVQALEYGRSGVATEWRNPDTGHYGTVVPGPAYTVNALDCRDYTHTIYVDGQPQVARGTACRQPDGTWRPVG